MIGNLKAQRILVMADACFAGDFLDTKRGPPVQIDSSYYRNALKLTARQVLTSGSSESVPDESEFGRQLVELLERNTEKLLDPNQIYDRIKLGMSRTQPLFGTLPGNEQGASFVLFLKSQVEAMTAAPTAGPSARPAAPLAAAPAPAAPRLTISRSYGSLLVSAASAGSLYLDGVALGELPAGAEARLDDVEVGERILELRYAGGEKESKAVTVLKGTATSVGFAWKKAAVVQAPPPAAVPPPTQSSTASPASIGDLVFVKGGSFMMGSTLGDSDEKPVHEVRVSDFYIGKYEVTQALYQSVIRENPSFFKGDSLPVEQVSWYDALAFCNALSDKEGLRKAYTISGTDVSVDFSANGYRLSTEAEWEYAAKGGQTGLATAVKYAGSDNLDSVAWYSTNSGSTTHAVGTKAPNALGIYDMSGNVWEWCWDWKGSYSTGLQVDPVGASSGGYRVSRGGGWDSDASYARSANRDGRYPEIRGSHLGFRLVRRP